MTDEMGRDNMKRLLLALASTLLFSCNAPQQEDISTIYTQAAATIGAEITFTAASLPSPTFLSTEAPTLLPLPSPTQPSTESSTLLLLSSPTLELTQPPTNIVSSSAMVLDEITGASCIPANALQTGTVVDVIDGDTIKVLLDDDGLIYSTRYIGMNTPEDTSQIEYFGPEATRRNRELVAFKKVTLVKDVSEKDRFGRLLRYIIADNVFVNHQLVVEGFANTASYPPDIACIDTFRAVESQASAAKLGLWGAPPTQVPLPTSPPNQVVLPPSSSGSGSSGGNTPCNCTGPDLDCGDFGTHAAAQACYDHCVGQGFGNIFRLDGNDNDGLACESLP